MKKNIYILLFGGLSLFVVSCNKEYENNLAINNGKLGIEVKMDDLASKAIVTGKTFAENSKITVILKNINTGVETDYDGSTNGKKLTFIYAASKWTTTPDVMLTAQRGKITAYYPDNLAIPSSVSADYEALTPTVIESKDMGNWLSVPKLSIKDKTVGLDVTEIDYMTGTGTVVSKTSTSSAIIMRHSMAMVGVRLIKGAYSGAGVLTNISIVNKGNNSALKRGEVNINTNEFTPNTTVINYHRSMTAYTATETTSGEYVAFFAFPAKLYMDGLITLSMTIDGTVRTAVDLPGASDGSKDWKAGNCILYDASINSIGLSITNVSIAKWQMGTSVDEGIQ